MLKKSFFALFAGLKNSLKGRFGSRDDEVERRMPEEDGEGEDELLRRRKDDNVGGEGG